MDIVTTFANGHRITEKWNGLDRRAIYVYERRERASQVHIDPERVLLLDVNYTNNSATLRPQARRAARKWSLAWLLWLQDHLLTYGFFV